jgi:hypothetical protein
MLKLVHGRQRFQRAAQGRQCPCRAAEIGPSGRQESTSRDLQRRKQRAGKESREGVRRRVRAKWANAAAKITDDLDVLLAFYDFPAEHWVHCAPRTRSSRPSRPCGCGSGSPKAPAPARLVSRWRSKSSSPPSAAGGWSTHPAWSPSSAPEPNSRTANPSNDPTNQEVKIKPRNTPIHRCCLLPVEDCALPCLTEQAKSRCYS